MSETVRVRRRLRIEVDGAILMGGNCPPKGELDAATARDARGVAILPSSALKGALREAAILRLQSEPGAARLPAPGTPRAEWSAEQRALTERLERVFGTSGGRMVSEQGTEKMLEDRGWLGRGIRVTDARPAGADDAPFATRHGVSIDRATRSRATGRLYRREVAEAREVVFEAELSGRLDTDDVSLLEDAVSLVTRLGNSSSRGLGAVRMSLVEPEPEAAATLVIPESRPEGESCLVVVEALEPLHLGDFQDGGNHRRTLRYVPGGALRGALVAAARRATGDAPEVSVLWGDDFHASDLWPAAHQDRMPLPAPRTLLADRHDHDLGRSDRCIALAVAAALAEEGVGVRKPGLETQHVLEPVDELLGGAELRTRLVTRLALDPATRAGAHSQLFTVEQIEPGACFVGSLVGLKKEVYDMLDLLHRSKEPIYLGGLRSRGLGAVRVRLRRLPKDDLPARVRAFRQQTAQALGALAAPLEWNPARMVQVVARTPLRLEGSGSVAERLGARIFPGRAVQVRGAWQRGDRRAGWFDKDGGPLPVHNVLRPGSCWLYEVEGELDLAHLRRVELAGVGEDLHLGLGRVAICPDLRSKN